MRVLRLLGAGCFVFLALSVAVLLFTPKDRDQPSAFATAGVIAVGAAAVGAAMLMFSRPEAAPPLTSEPFTARRAFQVAEYGDEGPHYFIELTDGSVLYLGGQYLCDYERIDDDPELNQPRRFPCTQFVVHRHQREGYVVDIACGGEVLEPEIVAPPNAVRFPEDGAVLGTTYDDLKTKALLRSP